MAEDDEQGWSIFDDPPDYQEKEKPFTYETYKLQDGVEISLRLVGHDPLWGHFIWNAARVLTAHLTTHASSLIVGKSILELGAGAGLPSINCAILGARKVVVTDYPSQPLIENLKFNVDANRHLLPVPESPNICAEGFLWGADIAPLTAHLQSATGHASNDDAAARFDVLILADILFNHSQHAALLKTVRQALALTKEARALVFFTPYRPWLLHKDRNFFELARESVSGRDEAGNRDQILEQHEQIDLDVRMISETVMDAVMFENDPGDEKMRRTVFGYELKWADIQ